MSERSKSGSPHRRLDDTHDFEALQQPEAIAEWKEVELLGNQRVSARGDFASPIELRLGRDGQTSPCYVIRYPSGRDHFDSYAVVQPEVACAQKGQGWTEFSLGHPSAVKLGRETSPQFRLGPDVSRRHCIVRLSVQDEGDLLEIESYGRNGLRVAMRSDDICRDVEQFDPSGIFD